MVKNVKEFRPELEAHFFGNQRSLEHGEIEVIDSGAAECWIYTSLSTEAPLRRGCEAGSVEEQYWVSRNVGADSSAASFVTTGHNVGTYVRDAQASTF